MLDQAPAARVSIGWLLAQLGERSFGLALLVMAVIALLPGASTVIGVLIAWPAVQMILGHAAAALPRPIARREVDVDRLARLIGLVVPACAGSNAWSVRAGRRRSRPPSG